MINANLIDGGIADNSDLLWQAQLAAYNKQEKVIVGPGLFRFTKPVTILVPTVGEGLAGKYVSAADAVLSGWNDVTGQFDPNLLPPMGTQFVLDLPAPVNLAEPFFQVHPGSSLIGLMFIDARQDPFAAVPVAYPPVIGPRSNYKQTQGFRPADLVLRDLWFVNNYFAIQGSGFRRHHISNIYGNPLAIGILLDDVDDLGEVENVHFHSGLWKETQWDTDQKMLKWISSNRIGLNLGQVDDLHLNNFFTHGAKYGVRCFPGANGSGPYGKLGNFTLEMCQEAVRIEGTTGGGGALCFSNFEIIVGTAFGVPSDDETGINVLWIDNCPVKFCNGVIRGARGDGVRLVPAVGGGPNAALTLSTVDVYDFGQGGTPGKVGIYVNTRNVGVFHQLLIQGCTVRGGHPNAHYGILLDGNAHMGVSGCVISEVGVCGFKSLAGSMDFILANTRLYFCNKAIEVESADRFVVANNLIMDNNLGSTWSGVNGLVINSNPSF